MQSEILLQRLNEDGLWRNPRRLEILSSQLRISSIALMRRIRRRGIIRGPYVINDREHRKVTASKRSQLVRSYAGLTGEPRSKVRAIAKKFGITERVVRMKLEASCGAQWYRREFDTATLEEREQLVELLNRNGRWKSGGVIKTVAKELGVSKASLTLRMSRWSIVRGPYVQLPQPQPRPSKSEQYARAFEQARGEPSARIYRIAKHHEVKTSTVRAALRKRWGADRYEKELGIRRRGPEALVALMNDAKIQKSPDVLGAASKRLGIKRDSLKSILSRKGIRRGSSGRYARQ